MVSVSLNILLAYFKALNCYISEVWYKRTQAFVMRCILSTLSAGQSWLRECVCVCAQPQGGMERAGGGWPVHHQQNANLGQIISACLQKILCARTVKRRMRALLLLLPL